MANCCGSGRSNQMCTGQFCKDIESNLHGLYVLNKHIHLLRFGLQNHFRNKNNLKNKNIHFICVPGTGKNTLQNKLGSSKQRYL